MKSSGKPKRARPNFRPTKSKASNKAAAPPSAPPVAPPPPLELEPMDTEPAMPNEGAESVPAANELLPNNTAMPDPSLAKTPSDNVAAAAAAAVAPPATAKQPPMASAKASSPTVLKKGRKRKTTGVAVGMSSPSLIQTGDPLAGQLVQPGGARRSLEEPTDFAAAPGAASAQATGGSVTTTTTQDLATRDAQTIPEDTSGLSRMNSFCSKFRSKRKKKDKNGKKEAAPVPEVEAAIIDETATSGNTMSAGPVVQIINGEIVLQESSMVVTGNSRPEEEFPVIEEEMQLAVVGASYNSFVSRRAPQHWSVEETELFYDALRQVGTDFGTMEAYFGKKRTRKQLKRKYQIESTKNPQLIDLALDPSSFKKVGTFVIIRMKLQWCLVTLFNCPHTRLFPLSPLLRLVRLQGNDGHDQETSSYRGIHGRRSFNY
jgi:transcription factor TFIIIB component B''